MSTLMIVVICIVGVIANWFVLMRQIERETTGAMGMGPVLLLAFVPWLIVVLGGVIMILEKLKVLR